MFILSALAAFKGAFLGSLLGNLLPGFNKEADTARPHKPGHGRPGFNHGHHSGPTMGPVLPARPKPYHQAPVHEAHQPYQSSSALFPIHR
ncbi:hypothetical protein [Pseudomonas sp. MWU16-30323]|uniref:hypothetical protein n=1 Tax=Pseudomonas sp. MWU16-30323 TaxID=2878094 RepID=UPI001CF9FAD4|nr:hypothetical protein [Pseudomonas sp. MWU16-30323]